MGVIAAGMIVGTICSANLGNTASNTGSLRDQAVDESQNPTATSTPSASPGASPAASPAGSPAPQRRFAAAPEMTIDPNKQYTATIKTDKGDITLDLLAKEAPITVNNFVFLARNDFYDGLTFHRVLDGFVAQGGDPDGTGAGGPGYSLPNERNSVKSETGSISMAKGGTVTSGSQFYITYAPQPNLDAQGFTVFGKVTSGMDVLRSLTKRDPQTNPRAAPGDRIQDITITEQ